MFESLTPQQIADEYNWILAMDEDGEWWAYNRKPAINYNKWFSPSIIGRIRDILPFTRVTWRGFWKTSLTFPSNMKKHNNRGENTSWQKQTR